MTSRKNKFSLGKVVVTQGAMALAEQENTSFIPYLAMHQTGEWGELCKIDKKLNEKAIENEGNKDKQYRVISKYYIKNDKNKTIYIVTEWDRSLTTILLPIEQDRRVLS